MRPDMKRYSIAIDGPSGAGKSTLARAAASQLGVLYVDTGAIYRTIAYQVLSAGVDPKEESAVLRLLPEVRLELVHQEDGLQHMLLNGEDVTEQIRQVEVSQSASVVAAYPGVRSFLLERQRELARTHHVIMDGRDIGTVVLPDADVKIFLTASAETRAKRRCLELEERGTPEPYEKVLQAIRERDWNDSHRETAPLIQAEDAVLLDTSALTFQESLAALLHIIKEKIDV